MHTLTALILRVVAVATWQAVDSSRLRFPAMLAAANFCAHLQLAADACEVP